MKNKKIVFMGTPEYATVIFEKLLEQDYNIVALFTQADKPVGRKQLITPPDIKKFSLENGLSLPIYQPLSLKEDIVVKQIKDLEPDIIIVAAYGQILTKEILEIAPCINLHASLLPKYRGASPIQQSLLNKDKYTGVTAMLMDIGLDSGDIIGYKYLKISDDMVVENLFDELAQIAGCLTVDILERFDSLDYKKQNLSLVSHCKKIKKSDGLVEFKCANEVYNKYSAFKSWPDIYLESGLKIKECSINEVSSKQDKSIILEINKSNIVVSCTTGSIAITIVQPSSKKAMSVVDYIRGKRLEVGDILN